MFFFLSKTVSYLALPLTLICLCFVVSLFMRNEKIKKRLIFAGIIALLFFTNEFISNEVMLAWEKPARPLAGMPHYKLAIVLTGTTVQREPDDRVYFTRGADRVTHTVQLYKLGLLDKILVSGGSGRITGEAEPEANKFKKAMVMMGVPDSIIILENETRNTAESAQQVRHLVDKMGIEAKECVLITSAFHMRRSLACYRKVGLETDYFSTDFYSFQRNYQLDSFVVPKADALVTWHKLVREWVGFVVYKLAGYI